MKPRSTSVVAARSPFLHAGRVAAALAGCVFCAAVSASDAPAPPVGGASTYRHLSVQEFGRTVSTFALQHAELQREAIRRLKDESTPMEIRAHIASKLQDGDRWPILEWCMQNVAFRTIPASLRDGSEWYPAIAVLVGSRHAVLELLPQWLSAGPRDPTDLKMMGYVLRQIGGGASRAEALIAATMLGRQVTASVAANQAQLLTTVRSDWNPP